MSKRVGVFNNVLGPVMRGPSSSHTAASFHIGRLSHDIFSGCNGFGRMQCSAHISFDECGSYAESYREQGSDKAFVSGLMGWDILDPRFYDAINIARTEGCVADFSVGRYPEANHPNWVKLTLSDASGAETEIIACSIGGGSVSISRVDGFDVDLRGDEWATLTACDAGAENQLEDIFAASGRVSVVRDGSRALCVVLGGGRPADDMLDKIKALGFAPRVVRPVFFPVRGEPIFGSAAELLAYAEAEGISAGEAALRYECALLGITRDEAMAEMSRRYDVMKASCERALKGELASPMQLLEPTADKIFASGEGGKLPFWGLHARAATRAMAIMHANGGMDVVCAAPTGGSAGALPAAIITLEDELGLSREATCMALFTAAAVGLIVDTRATFAAEVAGCQVEIGAGGAMASAACVEATGGSVRDALDAAAIAFQNTMGSVCDPVQGMVEIPCHTRNASAAAGAFVNAALIMGGYRNDIPLDETIDAVLATGEMLPPELRCTAKGGIAACPSAMAIKNKKK